MSHADRETKKQMNEMQQGQVLEIHATDQGAKSDLTAWAKATGNEMLEQAEDGDVLKFWIRKG